MNSEVALESLFTKNLTAGNVSNFPPSRKIGAFFHLPKTAGTTLHNVIVRSYEEGEVFQTPNASLAIESWQQVKASIRLQTRFITGHMFFDFCEEFPGSLELITLLRDPVERVISWYFHFCRHPELNLGRKIIEENMSLERCMDELQPRGLDNMYARRLSGLDKKDNETPFGMCGHDHLTRSLENLERDFCCVGITEDFDKAVMLFAHHFGWRKPFYRRENTGTNRIGNDAIASHVRKKIERFNEVDREIYECGRKLFRRSLAQRGIRFSLGVKLFQWQNRFSSRPEQSTDESGVVKNVQPRQGKATPPPLRVMTSLPRSGTHWLKNMISNVMKADPLEERLVDPVDIEHRVKNEAANRLVYEHFAFDLHGNVLHPDRFPGLRLILLYRHPADALISLFHYRAMKNALPEQGMDIVDQLKAYLRGSWPRLLMPNPELHGRQYKRTWRELLKYYVVDWLDSGYVWPVRYEDLVKDTRNELKKVLAFLGVEASHEQLMKAIEANSFGRLAGGRKPGQVNFNSHYRRGVPGEWREMLDADDVDHIRENVGDYVERMGYTLE